MLIKTILNNIHPLKHFVYQSAELVKNPDKTPKEIQVVIQPRSNSKAICSVCGKAAPGYDTRLPYRTFRFVPLWNIPVIFFYAMRRVNCKTCGIKTEKIPWAEGKSNFCNSFKLYLASWAKKLSWSDTAKTFHVSWKVVFESVKHVVEYGLENRDVSGILSIGVDEIKWKVGHKYLTVVYQLDQGKRRLLHVAKDRTEESFLSFFNLIGEQNYSSIQFVCSDMWRAYLKVIKSKLPNALHVLDRFHIRKHLNEAIDKTRRVEAAKMKKDNYEPILEKSRWPLMKNKENLTENQATKIKELLQYNTQTIRAYLHGDEFKRFWEFQNAKPAMEFLHSWNTQVMRSKIDPMKKFVKMLRNHEHLLPNWFKANGLHSSGPVEGLNCKAKVAMRKAYGYKDFKTAEIALFHQLGRLSEPKVTHQFV